MNAISKFCQTVGLHPLVGFGLFAIDWMLFAAEGATLGLVSGLTFVIGLLLSIPCILIQRHSFHDAWGAAIGKGFLIGILTAVPTALPAIVPLTGGLLGAASGLFREPSDNVPETDVIIPNTGG